MKFNRPNEGTGRVVINWIENNLSTCPLCKTSALWEIAMTISSISYNRYHFRCQNCMALISIAVSAIIGASKGLGIAGTVKEEYVTNDLKIESIGNNQKLEHLVGKEYPLKQVQDWVKET